MSDRDTLLGHLVPKITSHVEDAATDALAYILNTSCEAMGALNDLLQHGGFKIEPIRRVRTQVSYEEGSSRPDMTGEDNRGVRRLLVESKFGAPLLDGQASDYIKLLDKPGPAVLLFIAPEARSETLWAAIRRQMNESDLEEVASTSEESVQRVKVLGTERHLMLISWLVLLDRIDAPGQRSRRSGRHPTTPRTGRKPGRGSVLADSCRTPGSRNRAPRRCLQSDCRRGGR